MTMKQLPSDKFGHQMVDLLPTEKTAIEEVMVTAQRRFVQTLQNIEKTSEAVKAIEKWAHETEGRFREIGFVVVIDAMNIEEDTDGNPVFSPEISVTGKVEDEDFDFNRASFETQHGLLDGKVGMVKNNGLWVPPSVNLNG